MPMFVPFACRAVLVPALVGLAFFVACWKARAPGQPSRLVAQEIQCSSFVLVDEETGDPRIRIQKHPRLQAWGLYIMDDAGQERAQLLVDRESGNPQLMFLDEDYSNPELPSLGFRLQLALTGEASEPRVRLYAKDGEPGLVELVVQEVTRPRSLGDISAKQQAAGGVVTVISKQGEVASLP